MSSSSLFIYGYTFFYDTSKKGLIISIAWEYIQNVELIEWRMVVPLRWMPSGNFPHLFMEEKNSSHPLVGQYSWIQSVLCSIAKSYLTPWPHGLQHARLPCPLLSPGVCSKPCPLSGWCHPTISSSATLFSSCLQFFSASGSFPVSWLFSKGEVNKRCQILTSGGEQMPILGWTIYHHSWIKNHK